MDAILNVLSSVSFWENISLVLGFFYTVLLVKEKPAAWIFAFFTSIIVSILFFIQNIYLQFILNFYYALVAVYGYVIWIKKGTDNNYKLKVSEKSKKFHILSLLIGLPISILLAILLVKYFDYTYETAVLDAVIFVFAALATILQAKKVISNWVYFGVLNILAIYLCLVNELYTMSLLMFLYMCLALAGYFNWKKIRKSYKSY